MLEVIDPGLLASVQDAGRPQLAHLGISVGGAADPVSYRVGNLLVGNWRGEAAIEMTLKGGAFRFTTDAVFALTGADFGATLDDVAVPGWRTLRARAGQRLRLGATRGGARAYLCARGGIDVPEILGSRSAHLASGLGGRALAAGDRLPLGEAAAWETTLVATDPLEGEEGPIRVIAGPAWDRLPSGALTVTERSNRSGLRLAGGAATPFDGKEPVSEGVVWGTIQLPASGEPIVLMNEQATTGGYPVAAVVIRADLARLGRLKPRDRISFAAVTIPEAMEALCERERRIARAAAPSI